MLFKLVRALEKDEKIFSLLYDFSIVLILQIAIGAKITRPCHSGGGTLK